MIVLHATVGSFASSLAWLCNPQPNDPDNRVSTHYLIDKVGHITQLVTDDMTAWHAGRARWLGHTDINERSLGIELENDNSGHDEYPAAQLAACRDLCREKIARYHILRANVARHLDIAIPAGRKSDPAGFPWESFVASLYAPAAPIVRPPSPLIHTVKAGPRGAIARTDYRGSGAAVAYYPPGTPIDLDDFNQNEYRHTANGAGFIALGDLEGAMS